MILGLTGEEKDLKAGSVTNILQQALHSRDKKQIGKILTYTDTKLIKVIMLLCVFQPQQIKITIIVNLDVSKSRRIDLQ